MNAEHRVLPTDGRCEQTPGVRHDGNNNWHWALLMAFCAVSAAQTRTDQMPQIVLNENGSWVERVRNPYRPRFVPPVDFSNSNRIDNLIRAGQLYLSLQDAIALAIENNLDIELQRFAPRVAQSDLLRAE